MKLKRCAKFYRLCDRCEKSKEKTPTNKYLLVSGQRGKKEEKEEKEEKERTKRKKIGVG